MLTKFNRNRTFICREITKSIMHEWTNKQTNQTSTCDHNTSWCR